MTVAHFTLTPHDALVARDGRPFGEGQGQRMRGLPWLLPSVVAGSFRTALVKVTDRDFENDMPQRLLKHVHVAGVFPVHGQLYLPAPGDALAEPNASGKGIKQVHRITPLDAEGGCDWPGESLRPVMLSEEQAATDFKPAEIPEWWPVDQLARWLLNDAITFDDRFLDGPKQEVRDHVHLDADRGAAAEGQLFTTAGLNLTKLPCFETKKFAEITLAVRVTLGDGFGLPAAFWHPLGGERRLIHWEPKASQLWDCPPTIRTALSGAKRIRMVLATPAIFTDGWKPKWPDDRPPGSNVKLKLVGVTNDRWKAVSGWSLALPRGPKAIRRMVPAGAVYFFEVIDGDPTTLADCWLQSVCDDEQEQRDGFGLAVWGIW